MLVDQSDTMYYKFDVVHESRLHEKNIPILESRFWGRGIENDSKRNFKGYLYG